MPGNTGKCGCDCFHCPTFKNNIRTIEDRKRCSDGWEKYLNIRLSPEKLRACDGCSVSDSNRKSYYLNCKIRKCAIINEIKNCAFCNAFPCSELSEVHSLQKTVNRDEFIGHTGINIPENDYQLFIEPYAGLSHLSEIRKSIRKDDLRDFRKYSTMTRFAPFSIKEKDASLEIIYSLLTTICIKEDISYAMQQTLRKRREQYLRILLTVALYGIRNDSDDSLALDAGKYLAQKINAMHDALSGYLLDLREYDIHGEIIPLKEKGWLTPRGGLREEGWFLKLKFGESIGGIETLQILQKYGHRLEQRYGKQAYRFFNMADLSIMNT